ncbi:helix-turn-helix domain-containing protein [Eubacterium pyruvativorans]|uniref:helix-turn-helix domain-containing protein n=1 Tax=Eubacterium pyruvativorans TaxID=155865 RepID=UPI000B8137B9|nr:helix-turn-helix transcriptional regulator [Eubacterium pyruvativorans]
MITELIGNRIREYRLSQNLSQEKRALLSGIDRTYLASVEHGKRNISIINLEKIINVLGYSFEDFFKDM